MCINESLRLYPPIPLLARTLGEEIQIGDYKLPKKSKVVISPYFTHRLEEIYENAGDFRPERFAKDINLNSLAFSSGPR